MGYKNGLCSTALTPSLLLHIFHDWGEGTAIHANQKRKSAAQTPRLGDSANNNLNHCFFFFQVSNATHSAKKRRKKKKKYSVIIAQTHIHTHANTHTHIKPFIPFAMNYFGQWSNLELLRQDGTTRLAADVLRDVPYVVLFFGASWSKETEEFFPLLERFYERHHKSKGFEVVYISRDYNKAEMMRGFLLAERATSVAGGQKRRDNHREERHRQQQQEQQPQPYPRHAPLASPADVKAKVSVESLEAVQTHTQPLGNHKLETNSSDVSLSTPPPSSSSSPPPLKRVAELIPGTATNSFSGPFSPSTSADFRERHGGSGCLVPRSGGGFWAVPYDHVGVVGVPLLYHLRVASYPGVVVCRNKPLDLSVTPQQLQQLLPPISAVAYVQDAGLLRTGAAPRPTAAAAASTDAANAPRPRKKTPMLAHRACYPDVVTIAGRFMLESADPAGDNFPWTHMGSHTRFAATLFFVIVFAVAAVVLSVVLPAVFSIRQVRQTSTAAAAAA